MVSERHLILQEIILPPASEWTPPPSGWIVARIAEGVGYWVHNSTAREFQAGDGFVASKDSRFVLRASQLGLLKLEFFFVQPNFLNGVLTIAEGHQLAQSVRNNAARLIPFAATDPVGQKFTQVVKQTRRESLPVRSALLQLWSQAVAGTFTPPLADHSRKLHERFRQLVAQVSDVELATRSLTELAGQLNCSERHFSRLFRQEFGVPLRTRQRELRLQRAGELLAASDTKIASVAHESGYRHIGLFNLMFKKQFGMSPSVWRKNQKSQAGPSRLAAGIALLLQWQFSDMIEIAAGFVT